MSALGGVMLILGSYMCAGWLGYQLGIERGMQKIQTKRKRYKI